MGNGQKERGEGVCCGVRLKVQGVEIVQNFFLMELGGTEMVLGMDWLSSLGKIEADFRAMTLQWKVGGRSWKMVGDPSLCRAQATWKTTMKALKEDGEGYYIASNMQQPVKEVAESILEQIKGVLQEFPEVFQLPKGLSPEREQDHAINLKEHAEIPNICPYRYPLSKK